MEGDTALFGASGEGHVAVVRYLVSEGKATVDLQHATQGMTPLFLAVNHNFLEVARILVLEGHASVDLTMACGTTPLCHAAEQGHVDIVRFLVLEGRATVDLQKPHYGITPLFEAVSSSHDVDVVRFLVVEGNARVDIPADFAAGECYPLLVASGQGNLDIVRCLVDDGKANIHQKNHFEFNAVQVAAANNHTSVVKYLVKRGADLDSEAASPYAFPGMHGTPLEIAQRTGASEAAEYLARKVRAQCCAQGKTQKCSRCEQVEYCSRACQTRHWRSHKPNCKRT